MWGGAGGLGRLGEVAAWEGAETTPAWRGACSKVGGAARPLTADGQVQGGEGAQFPPGVEGEVRVWVPQLCRHLTLSRCREHGAWYSLVKIRVQKK